MIKADFHLHTNYVQFYEGIYSPEKLIDRLVELGYDAVAITEHEFVLGKHYQDGLKTYRDFRKYAKKKGLILLPGIEPMIEGVEILLINFTDDIRKHNTFEKLKKLKKKRNFIAIAPHPFLGVLRKAIGNKIYQHLDFFDAIEVNAGYSKGFNPNKRAIKLAKKHKKPLIGSSDCHYLPRLNYTYTLLNSKKNIPSIINAIKKGKTKVVTKPLPSWLLILSGIHGIITGTISRTYYLLK